MSNNSINYKLYNYGVFSIFLIDFFIIILFFLKKIKKNKKKSKIVITINSIFSKRIDNFLLQHFNNVELFYFLATVVVLKYCCKRKSKW